MTRQSLRVPIQRSQFNAEANKAILQELVKNLELSKMSLMKETPLIQIIDKPVLPIHKTELSSLKGMVSGGFIFGLLGSIFLLIRRRRHDVN